MRAVLIHGLGQDASSWDRVVSFLPEPDRFLCPDLTKLLRCGEAAYGDLYRAFAEYCGGIPGNLNLCGLSLGAVLALHYTVDHPGRVESAVLIGAQYRMPKKLLRFQNAVLRAMPERFFASTGFPKRDFLRLTATMMDLDFSARLGEVSCPALIVCGERDGANRKAARELAGSIPGAEYRLVEDAGHELNREVPEELARLLEDFYREHGRS